MLLGQALQSKFGILTETKDITGPDCGLGRSPPSVLSTQVYFKQKRSAVAKKGKVRIITLECTEARKEGRPASRYTTTKNTQTHPERLEKKKYNPNLQRHTVHREIK